MFSQASVILFTEGGVSVPACTTGHMTRGGLCPGGSLSGGSLSRGVSVWGVSVRDPPVRVGGTHPTGMHSCFKCKYTLLLMANFRIHL